LLEKKLASWVMEFKKKEQLNNKLAQAPQQNEQSKTNDRGAHQPQFGPQQLIGNKITSSQVSGQNSPPALSILTYNSFHNNQQSQSQPNQQQQSQGIIVLQNYPSNYNQQSFNNNNNSNNSMSTANNISNNSNNNNNNRRINSDENLLQHIIIKNESDTFGNENSNSMSFNQTGSAKCIPMSNEESNLVGDLMTFQNMMTTMNKKGGMNASGGTSSNSLTGASAGQSGGLGDGSGKSSNNNSNSNFEIEDLNSEVLDKLFNNYSFD
jgi:hypothetical protein